MQTLVAKSNGKLSKKFEYARHLHFNCAQREGSKK
jgi:hypothetical protein